MTTLRFLVLGCVVGLLGCNAVGMETYEQQRARQERQAREQREFDRKKQEYDRQQQARYQQWLAQEAAYDQMCLDPQTTYQVNWCAERRAYKERQFYEQQRRAEWSHQEQLQQQQHQFEKDQARREAIRHTFDRPKTVNCTTTSWGGTAHTTCD